MHHTVQTPMLTESSKHENFQIHGLSRISQANVTRIKYSMSGKNPSVSMDSCEACRRFTESTLVANGSYDIHILSDISAETFL